MRLLPDDGEIPDEHLSQASSKDFCVIAEVEPQTQVGEANLGPCDEIHNSFTVGSKRVHVAINMELAPAWNFTRPDLLRYSQIAVCPVQLLFSSEAVASFIYVQQLPGDVIFVV